MFATVEEGFDYFESFVNVERGAYSPRRWRLERMRALLEAFGDPHRAYPTIHVAGSKGKGSTAAYAAHILHAAGHRVGLYTSPHVESYRERVRVLDGSLTDDVFLAAFERIAAWVNDQRRRV
ncbi:MAG: bifunctional folylpolyglutamate synthase/dihydrofolate synthase, partial [Spirochaetaceae bacterium]